MCQSEQHAAGAAVLLMRPRTANGAPDWLPKMGPRAAVPASLAKAPAPVRKKLWDLPRNLHCSVIGTCMTSAELRKVLGKFSDADLQRMAELDLHEQGVMAAGRHDDAGRALHKALDRRHEAAVRKFGRAARVDELRALWREARQHGDLPGAYWAAMTHPQVTDELVHEIFGDVHMLSHLVGAANRTALTRIAELEEREQELDARIERQQARFRQIVEERDAMARRVDALMLERAAHDGHVTEDALEEGAATALPQALETLRDRLAAEIGRRERAEQKRAELREALSLAQREGAAMREREAGLAAEVAALEALLVEQEAAEERAALSAGTVILYVGGRPAQVEQMRAHLAAQGVELLDHDGGLQERVGMLAGMISRADLVVFPVDCISHGAMHAVKRLCGQAGKPYLPLRSAGFASFASGLARAAGLLAAAPALEEA